MTDYPINICYSADENYAMQAGVSICSVLEHNLGKNITFWLLCEQYSESTIQKFKELEKKYNTRIVLVDVTHRLNELKNSSLYVPEAIGTNGLITFMYARLFIGSLLPETVHRVLYMDCDTIVNNTLDELFDFKFSKTMAAVIDLYPVNYNKVIGFSEEDLYFNSGVLLINLDMWRKEEVEKWIINHISTLSKTYYMHDQDVLNVVLKNDIDILPLKYNMMYISRAYEPSEILSFTGKNEQTYYTMNDINEAQNNIAVIHYAGDYYGKPWDYPDSNVYAKKWNKMKHQTPWKGDITKSKSFKNNFNQSIHELLGPYIKGYWLQRTRKRFEKQIKDWMN